MSGSGGSESTAGESRARSRSPSADKSGSGSGEMRLYVGGLGGPREVSEGELRDLFTKATNGGKVVTILMKGHYAFVGMENMDQAKDAIKALHGTIQFNNRRMIVEYTKDSKPSATGAGSEATPTTDKCFHCGKPGHWARDCPTRADRDLCYRCHRKGHIARDCPEDPSVMAQRGAPYLDRDPYRRGPPSYPPSYPPVDRYGYDRYERYDRYDRRDSRDAYYAPAPMDPRAHRRSRSPPLSYSRGPPPTGPPAGAGPGPSYPPSRGAPPRADGYDPYGPPRDSYGSAPKMSSYSAPPPSQSYAPPSSYSAAYPSSGYGSSSGQSQAPNAPYGNAPAPSYSSSGAPYESSYTSQSAPNRPPSSTYGSSGQSAPATYPPPQDLSTYPPSSQGQGAPGYSQSGYGYDSGVAGASGDRYPLQQQSSSYQPQGVDRYASASQSAYSRVAPGQSGYPSGQSGYGTSQAQQTYDPTGYGSSSTQTPYAPSGQSTGYSAPTSGGPPGPQYNQYPPSSGAPAAAGTGGGGSGSAAPPPASSQYPYPSQPRGYR